MIGLFRFFYQTLVLLLLSPSFLLFVRQMRARQKCAKSAQNKNATIAHQTKMRARQFLIHNIKKICYSGEMALNSEIRYINYYYFLHFNILPFLFSILYPLVFHLLLIQFNKLLCKQFKSSPICLYSKSLHQIPIRSESHPT